MRQRDATGQPLDGCEEFPTVVELWVDRQFRGLRKATAATVAITAAATAIAIIAGMASGGARSNINAVVLPFVGFGLLHAFVLAPIQAGWLLARAFARLNERGDDEGASLHLLAAPGQPRPLYFWIARASLRRVAKWSDASCAIVIAGNWIGQLVIIAALWGFARTPRFARYVMVCVVLTWMARGAARFVLKQVAAVAGNLGGLATVAMADDAKLHWIFEARDAADLDESWGTRQPEKLLAYLRHQATRAVLLVGSLATYAVVAVPSLFLPIYLVNAATDHGGAALLFGAPVGVWLLSIVHRRAANVSRSLYSEETIERYRLVLPE